MTPPADPGWRWLALFLAGPVVWALAFTAAYALHGWDCARLPFWSGTRPVLLAIWLLPSAGLGYALVRAPRGNQRDRTLLRLGLWIGLAGTAFTLAPVALLGLC